MNYIGEFVAELKSKSADLQLLLGSDPSRARIESILKEGINNRWVNLPEPARKFSQEFAVDSSSAYRGLSNGIDIFIVRSLAIGSNNVTPRKAVRFEAIKSPSDSLDSSNFERMLRDLAEVEAAISMSNELKRGDIIMLDGSVYGKLAHLKEELNIVGWQTLPLAIFERLTDLFNLCDEKGVTIVGVSKFSRTRVLCNALLSERGVNISDPGFLDVECLYKWKGGQTGHTTPLLLGLYALQQADEFQTNPETYINQHFRGIPESRKERAISILRSVPDSPSIAMTHIIPAPGEQPLRIDVPANCIGSEEKLRDVDPYRFLGNHALDDVISHVLFCFGGTDVYNALLYVADKDVRLGEETVDTVYKQVLSDELGIRIEYDRSSRRFH